MGTTPRPLDLKIDVAQLSDPGRDPNKQINEDSCGYATTKFGHLCVLCDGMGGHYGGQEASRRAIKTIFDQIELAGDSTKPAQALKGAVEEAARRVYELGGPPENKVRPGSTVVAMLLHDAGVDVAHVGDSRAFVIRSGQIYPLTRDHSMVQAMIDAGFLTEEQAIGHPDANKITRALGMKPEVEVEIRPEPMELFPGDLLMTTSDGLTDLALNKDILGATKQALASGGLDHAVQQLVRLANDRGGHDNITVQLVRVTHTAPSKTKAPTTHAGAPATTMPDLPAAGQPRASAAQAAAAPVVAAAPIGPAPGAAAPAAMGSGPGVAYGHAPQPLASGPGLLPPPQLDTVVGRPRMETIPMQPASTAHDGTSRLSHASAPADGGSPAPGLALPPQQHALSPTLSSTLDTPAPGLAGYRLDGVQGLNLPPASARFGAPAHGAQHRAGGFPTPTMTPSQPAAAGMAHAASFGGVPSSAPRGHGGSVLFLILAVSFVVAIVIMAIVWAVFLR